RRELAGIGGKADALKIALDLALQGRKFRRWGDASPERVRFPGPEGADAGKAQQESGTLDPVQGRGGFLGDMSFDIADEAQRQMIVLGIHPSRAGKPASQERQGKNGVAGYLKCHEKSWHGGLPKNHPEPA